MKKIILIAISSLFIQSAFAKKVTFNLDMTGQAKSPLGIHVMGDFQSAAGLGADWTPNTCLMIQDIVDTNFYHYTVDIPAFAKYEYKYINGDQSYEVEIVPVEAQVGHNFDDNRWIYVDSLDADTMKLANLMFSANAPAGLKLVRFSVDLTTTPYAPAGVHVAGNFQSNNPATDRMYSFEKNVFELISYVTGGSYTYKFYNGNVLSAAETVPSSCATSGERTFASVNDLVLTPVCFSSCSTCYPTSVSNINNNTSIQLFPNPVSTYTTIRFNDNSSLHHLVVTDMTGHEVYQKQQIKESNFQLSVVNFKQGVYHLMVENNEGLRNTQKIIVQ